MSERLVTNQAQSLPQHATPPVHAEQPKAKRPGCTCDCGTCPCGPNAKVHDHPHHQDKPALPPTVATDPAKV